MLDHKIDFTVLITATGANPNGDPLDGNRPRMNSKDHGEISDVCIKRKIRNYLQDHGEKIFLQSDDRCDDGCDSLHQRADKNEKLKEIFNLLNSNKSKKNDNKKSRWELEKEYHDIACAEWIDVRSFGQVFALKNKTDKDKDKNKGKGKESENETEKEEEEKGSISIPVRGPVTIHQSISVSPIDIISMKITKSVNNESDSKKGSDTMGYKHRIAFGLYVVNGSMNCQLAEKTGFSNEDALKIKEALINLFENDASSARPEGSMEVCRVYWWEHNCKTPKISTAKIHRSVKISLKEGVSVPAKFEDYDIALEDTGVAPEIIDLM